MGVSALTIDGSTQNPGEVLRRIERGIGRLISPSAAIVFVTGHLVEHADAIADGIASRHPGLCATVAATESLFTERGELEGRDGFGCLLHSGRPSRLLTYESSYGPFSRALSAEPPGNRTQNDVLSQSNLALVPAMHLFSNLPSGIGQIGRISPEYSGLGWFGADTTTDAPIWTVAQDGDVGTAAVCRLELPGLRPPIIVSASCCRVVSEPMTVTGISGTTLLELDGTPALIALSKVTSQLAERSWIVLAMVGEECAATHVSVDSGDAPPRTVAEVVPGSPTPTIFRPLRGIDPARGALVLREAIPRGSRVAIAVRDDHLARKSLDESLRCAKMTLSGAYPRFGLYFEGLGRGRQLFGAPNVEHSLVRQAFGEFPLLGSRSTLEFQELGGSLIVQAMSGELALFTNAS